MILIALFSSFNPHMREGKYSGMQAYSPEAQSRHSGVYSHFFHSFPLLQNGA